MVQSSSTDVALLIRIAEAGSLSAAARQLRLSPASVSMRLAEVESRLGMPLFRRNTRSLHLTQEGERYLKLARPVLDMLEAAEDAARGVVGSTEIKGSVRLSAPVDLGRQVISAMVDQFAEENPFIHVALVLSDELTDLQTQNVDLAVRYGEMVSKSGTTVGALVNNRRLICGAPAYLNRVGRPRRPSDLGQHNCLCLQTETSYVRRWPIGRSWISVDGDRSSNDGGMLRSWAIAGRGLILKSWWDVRQDLATGRLEELFTDLPTVSHPLRLARPAGRSVPLRVSRLADHLKRCFKSLEVQSLT